MNDEYPIGNFAPGYYICKCTSCQQMYNGDKRSNQCKTCAIKLIRILKLKQILI